MRLETSYFSRMKNYISIGLAAVYLCVLTTSTFAQNKAPNPQNTGGVAAAAVGGLAIAAIAGAIAYEQYIETLELQATQQYLNSFKESDIFSVKLLSDQLTSMKDLSSTSVLAFGITEYEAQDNFLVKPKHRIMIMLLSHGWANEYGINFSFVTTKVLDRNNWNSLYFNYINSMAYPKLSSPQEMKALIKVNQKKYNDASVQKMSIYNRDIGVDEYFIDGNILIPISSNIKIKGNKIAVEKFSPDGIIETYVLASKLKLDGDTYIHSDFDSEISIIFNENRLGIYDKNLKNLVQINNKGVTAIHTFVNQ